MPELPDVEVFRRYLEATSLQQTIASVHLESPELLRGTSPQALGRIVHDAQFTETRRHGKYLFAGVSDSQWLVLHFGMSGRLAYFRHRSDMPAHTRCLFRFANGCDLAYIAPRKLGSITLATAPRDFIAGQGLGPDALQVDCDDFPERLRRHRGQIKNRLMDQQQLCGIGNVYSDEMLVQARIHPRCRVRQLSNADIRQLCERMSSVLRQAIDAEADPAQMPSHFLLPQRKKGGHCPRCGDGLERLKVAGRTAWLCAQCRHCAD